MMWDMIDWVCVCAYKALYMDDTLYNEGGLYLNGFMLSNNHHHLADVDVFLIW